MPRAAVLLESPMPLSPALSTVRSSAVFIRWTALSAPLLLLSLQANDLNSPPSLSAASGVSALFFDQYCYDCHDTSGRKGDLVLENLDPGNPATHAAIWEKVVRKLDHRQMPPLDEERPDDSTYRALVNQLTANLDRAAAAAPNPGRTDTFRRLMRTEYQNAVRDLLALEIDATALLPHDEPSHGFDNVTVGNLSPTLLDRYVSAAQKIARLAVGTPRNAPGGDTFRVAPDVTQESHVEGLPIGTRGGAVFPYVFPNFDHRSFRCDRSRRHTEPTSDFRRSESSRSLSAHR